MKTAMPMGLMSTLQSHAPSLASPVKMKLKPGDAKLMSNQINRTAPTAPSFQAEKDPFAKAAAAHWADALGRSMARADMEKAARAEDLEAAGIAAGEAFAKMAGGLGAAALNFAKSHPGASIGGALGLAHGLANGGIGTGLVEGATGAGIGHGIQAGGAAALAHPELGPKMRAAKDAVMARMGKNTASQEASDLSKFSSMGDELQKIAFGAALAGAARAAIPAITNFVKANPLKAGLGAASAVGNFASARKNGEGLGSALLSGGMGAATAL